MSIYDLDQEMKVYVFGNGNTSFEDFTRNYAKALSRAFFLGKVRPVSFIVGDFKGVDTLTMEYLKTLTENVSVYHMGVTPRYYPTTYGTKVAQWKKVGGFVTDRHRDTAAIEACTHYIAYDINSTLTRISGTKWNIDRCNELKKVWITV